MRNTNVAMCLDYVSTYTDVFFSFFLFIYESLSSLGDIETNSCVAMKATLLINSLRMAFYLLAFDVRHLCKGYGRMQSWALSLQGPLRLPASSRGRPSFRKYWLLDSERLCVCIGRASLERNCKCLCVCPCVCCACLSPSTNGEIGGESRPECKGHRPCKGRKEILFSSTRCSKMRPLGRLCVPMLMIARTYTTYMWSLWVTSHLVHTHLSSRLSTTNQDGFHFLFPCPYNYSERLKHYLILNKV